LVILSLFQGRPPRPALHHCVCLPVYDLCFSSAYSSFMPLLRFKESQVAPALSLSWSSVTSRLFSQRTNPLLSSLRNRRALRAGFPHLQYPILYLYHVIFPLIPLLYPELNSWLLLFWLKSPDGLTTNNFSGFEIPPFLSFLSFTFCFSLDWKEVHPPFFALKLK